MTLNNQYIAKNFTDIKEKIFSDSAAYVGLTNADILNLKNALIGSPITIFNEEYEEEFGNGFMVGEILFLEHKPLITKRIILELSSKKSLDKKTRSKFDFSKNDGLLIKCYLHHRDPIKYIILYHDSNVEVIKTVFIPTLRQIAVQDSIREETRKLLIDNIRGAVTLS